MQRHLVIYHLVHQDEIKFLIIIIQLFLYRYVACIRNHLVSSSYFELFIINETIYA